MANDQLLQYYERELTFLRRMGARFAQEYPKIASRLDLEPSKCEDPHVERMLEAFAFLAARVHKRIDEDVPEVSEALLEIVYPHYVRPIPAMSLVEFELDREQGKLTSGLPVPRNSLLYSRPVAGVPCKFTTCYDTTLWPVRVASLEWMTPDRLKPAVRVTDAVAALRLELHCFADLEFKALDLSALRLHLAGDSGVTFALYELLCNNCTSIIVREPGGKKSLTLPASSLQPVGFAEGDGLLPYPRRSFLGYRLLQEYFTFPEKFLFFDLAIFDAVRSAGFGEKAEIIFLIPPVRARRATCAARDRAVAALHARRLHAGGESVPAGLGTDSVDAAEDGIRVSCPMPGDGAPHRSSRSTRSSASRPDRPSRCASSRCTRTATRGTGKAPSCSGRRDADRPSGGWTAERTSISRSSTCRLARCIPTATRSRHA